MPDRLLLWDLDGTLLWARGLGRVFDEVMTTVLGAPGPRVAKGGKTDPQIAREILLAASVAPGELDARLAAALELYRDALAAAGEDAHAESVAQPGVPELLERLASVPGVVQTVLTGNVDHAARVKVARLGLDRWLDLEIGAFGSDDHDRLGLVPVALERAARLRGRRFTPDQVWVIGDTPNDHACARVAGVRCLLVTNGAAPADQLVDLGADLVVPDLSDTERLVALLTG